MNWLQYQILSLREILFYYFKKRICFRVEGSSMEPSLFIGDLVFVKKNTQGKLPKVNDLVVIVPPLSFSKDKTIMIKRVSSLGNHTFAVKSDNVLEGTDSRIFGSLTNEDLIGRVKFIRKTYPS